VTIIHRILTFLLLVTVLAACAVQSDIPQFDRMSDTELAMYNSTADVPDMVLCVEEVRIGSHIRKKFCATLEEYANALENQSNQLGVMNHGGSSVFGTRRGIFD
jgi:hypothetical protein